MEARVVGVTFKNDEYEFDRQKIIAGLCGKEKVYLKREPANKFDSNAVAVMLKRYDGKDWKIGYVRAELAAFLSDMWPKYKFYATISEIRNGSIEENRPYGISIDIKKRERSKLKRKKRPPRDQNRKKEQTHSKIFS